MLKKKVLNKITFLLMNNMKFKTSVFLLIFFALFLFFLVKPQPASADGVIIEPYPNRWDYSVEDSQKAVINYQEGVQKMYLSVETGKSVEKATWIFPVPSEPEEVSMDVASEMPDLHGEEISKKAKLKLDNINQFLPVTQIYTIPFISFWAPSRRISTKQGEGMLANPLGSGKVIDKDVVVHKHLEKKGVITEAITAKNTQALYDYFQSKDLKIKQGSISVLDHYIGKEFTFVASWFSEESEKGEQRGIFVSFPTDKIYYPLRPTSAYGGKVVPATIRTIGYKSPELFDDIEGYTETEYFVEEESDLNAEFGDFYEGTGKNLKYTKINIEAPSELLTQDLWISSEVPLRANYSTFVAQHSFLSGLLMWALSSILASLFAGWLLFKRLRNKKGTLKLILVGLGNYLSLLGVIAVTPIIKTKRDKKEARSMIKHLRSKGYVWKRRLAAVLFMMSAPFLIVLLANLPFVIREIVEWNFHGFWETIAFHAFYIVPLLLFGAAWFLKRIKEEDKSLFRKLKSAGHSTWSFHSKDKKKWFFVPLFSATFLLIAFYLVKMVKVTV